MNEIIEDTISRNKKFKEERLRRLEAMKRVGAPIHLIEREELVSKMTIAEYDIFLKEENKSYQKQITEYAKNNPHKKEIVEKIYELMESLTYDFLTYSSHVKFLSKIDPLKFMSEDDYYHELYNPFFNHAHDLYQKKYIEEWNKDNLETENKDA